MKEAVNSDEGGCNERKEGTDTGHDRLRSTLLGRSFSFECRDIAFTFIQMCMTGVAWPLSWLTGVNAFVPANELVGIYLEGYRYPVD